MMRETLGNLCLALICAVHLSASVPIALSSLQHSIAQRVQSAALAKRGSQQQLPVIIRKRGSKVSGQASRCAAVKVKVNPLAYSHKSLLDPSYGPLEHLRDQRRLLKQHYAKMYRSEYEYRLINRLLELAKQEDEELDWQRFLATLDDDERMVWERAQLQTSSWKTASNEELDKLATGPIDEADWQRFLATLDDDERVMWERTRFRQADELDMDETEWQQFLDKLDDDERAIWEASRRNQQQTPDDDHTSQVAESEDTRWLKSLLKKTDKLSAQEKARLAEMARKRRPVTYFF